MSEGSKITTGAANIVRMLNLLRRIEKALAIEGQPLSIEKIEKIIKMVHETKKELLLMKKPEDARICDYLLRYMEQRRDEFS